MKPTTAPTLLVLAAGMGNRYRGLKQIDPVGHGGETIIDYSMYDALRAGFGKVVFVIRSNIEQTFKQVVGARFEEHIAVEYVFQELNKLPSGSFVPADRTKPWGTLHAVLMAADVIDEPFAVINADDFYGSEGYRILAQHLQSGATNFAMVGFVVRNTLSDFGAVSRGDGMHVRNTDSTGRITTLSGDEIVSMNMWGFTPHIFGQFKEQFQRFLRSNGSDIESESYLPSTMNELVLDGQARVKVLRTKDSWTGVTYREDHPRVVQTISRLIDSGSYPNRLWP